MRFRRIYLLFGALRNLITASLLIVSNISSFGQVSISGKILNKADNKPVAKASVFLSNATIGSEAADNGTFILHNVKSGKYELIVSIIGFESYRQALTVENQNIILPVIELSPKAIILNEISVKPVIDPDRDRNYEWFKDEFLGTSPGADDCKILNSEVLDLKYNDTSKILIASSVDFLEVENNALGYKIKYLLTDFIKDSKNTEAQKIQFRGSVLFEEMKGTPSQEKRWQKRRQQVYEASIMHFLRSGLNNTSNEEGFRVLRVVNAPNPQRPPDSIIAGKIRRYESLKNNNKKYRDTLAFWQGKLGLPKTFQTVGHTPLKQTDFIKLTDKKGLYALTGDNGALLVTYNKNRHFTVNEKLDDLNDPGNNESTLVTFISSDALFDKNGAFADPNSLLFKGAWAKNRLAELLPVDYEPPQNQAINAPQLIAAEDSFRGTGPLKDKLLKLKTKSDSINNNKPGEKLYLQFDKPYYAIGDTIWFKAYLFNSSYFTPSDKSNVMYVDIASDSNKVIKQYKLQMQAGLSWGNISLDEKEFTSGTYTLRAYTNWMRNFGDDYFFYRSFYISSANEKKLLVTTRFNTSNVNGNTVLNARLLFSDISQTPFAVKPLQLQVMNGSRHLFKQKLQTGVDGSTDINFNIPQKSSGLAIVAETEQKDKKAIIPVILDRDENIDLQFLPEGGNLVAGLPAHIGFKAIGEDGKGINVSGIITDHERKQVAEFKSLHNGMGSFNLMVIANESYTAKVTLPGGAAREYPLPAIKSTGTVLQVKCPMESDSLEVAIGVSSDLMGGSFFLIGKSRGIVCYAAIVNFHEGNFVKRKISKNLFPTGITHFTLMTTKYQPLNERQVFIDRRDNLDIQITADKLMYGREDSVALKLRVTDKDGNPVSGNFSLAVTDDIQVKSDSLDTENILTSLLLGLDLKGYIETPGYYLSAKTGKAWQALDNLLLTQGWIGYDWKEIFNPHPIIYPPEHGFIVKGQVTNVLNKPVKGTNVLLFSRSPALFMDTITDNEGKFIFRHFPEIDTPVFVMKAVNKNGKSFNVGITVDEIKPPDFIKPACPLIMPWYVNGDSTLLNYTKNDALIKQRQNFRAGGHMLKEVKITAKKVVKDSQNLNGPGNADVVLDEKDLEAAGKKTWLQLLQENLPKFTDGTFSSGGSMKAHKDIYLSLFVTDEKPIERNEPLPKEWYFVDGKPLRLIVDGISVSQGVPITSFRDLTNYLTSHSAEDIKGFEVIHSTTYAAAYFIRYQPYAPFPLVERALSSFPPVFIGPSDIAFVEITTRGGHGPIIDNTPGMYLYKPFPLSRPGQFYKPRYIVKDTIKHSPDLRSTIDWEPNITTDASGEAKLWFYTADKPSTYTITIEGSDMSGRLGFKTKKINIK